MQKHLLKTVLRYLRAIFPKICQTKQTTSPQIRSAEPRDQLLILPQLTTKFFEKELGRTAKEGFTSRFKGTLAGPNFRVSFPSFPRKDDQNLERGEGLTYILQRCSKFFPLKTSSLRALLCTFVKGLHSSRRRLSLKE